MMVSPKAAKEAGDKFGQKPVCAGPYKFVERVQQDRIVVEKFADYWNKANVHIDRITYLPVTDSTVRLANLRSGQLDLIERPLATDIKEMRANPKLKTRDCARARLSGPDHQCRQGRGGEGLRRQAHPRGAGARDRPQGASSTSSSTASSSPGNQWVNPQHPYYPGERPGPAARSWRAPRSSSPTRA